MVIGPDGIAIIKKSEGCSLEAYVDVHNADGSPRWAIGWAHSSLTGPPEVYGGMVITQEQADQILLQDLKPYEKVVNIYVKVPLNQHQFDALCSFTYNCGPGSLRALVSASGLNTGDYNHVSDEMMNYNKSQGRVLLGLTRRRKAEGVLFNTPVEN